MAKIHGLGDEKRITFPWSMLSTFRRRGRWDDMWTIRNRPL